MGSRRKDRRENRSPPPPPFNSQGLNPPATLVEPHRGAPRRAGAAPPRRVGRAEVKGAPGPGVGTSGRQAGPLGALPRGFGPHSHPAAAVRTATSNPRPDGRLRSRGRRSRASSPRAGARPARQRGGRPSAAAAAPFLLCLCFLQPTPRPPRAAAEPVPALPGPHAPSARLATRTQPPLRGRLRCRCCLGRAA